MQSIKKGDSIDKTRTLPLLLVRTSSRSSFDAGNDFYNYCQVCGRDVSLSDPTSLANKILSHITDRNLTQQLKPAILYYCSRCEDKRVRYCSEHCRALGERYALHIHHVTCRGSTCSSELKDYGRQIHSQIQTSLLANDYQELFAWHCILVTSLVILSNIQHNDTNAGEDDKGNRHQSVEFPSGLHEFFRHVVATASSQDQYRDARKLQVHTAVEDMWSLFSAALHNSFPTAILVVPQTITCSLFFTTYQLVRECLHRISLADLASEFISKHILNLSHDILPEVLKELKPFVTAAFRNDGTRHVEDKDGVSPKIIQYRQAARIAQTASESYDDDSPFFSLRHEFYALCFPVDIFAWDALPHSCAPTCIIEGTREVDDEEGKENQSNDMPSVVGEGGKIKLLLFALHDIDKGEPLSLSRISNVEQDFSNRSKALKQTFGASFCCVCVRCRFEQSPNTAANLSFVEMKRIGDFAMQNGRFLDAINAYNAILSSICQNNSKTGNYIGDILHAKCAAYLGMGKFMVAQRLWNDASKVCPSHEGIALQVRKQAAYHTLSSPAREGENKRRKISGERLSLNRSLPEFITLIDGECYVTKYNHPVVCAQECQQAIEWTENYASSTTGWTTSRHYAVPTTDLPIHDVPPLLKWFNNLMECSVRPLLARQFSEEEVGVNGCNIHIHDAFVVRYNASEQRHLPLHRDESSHSFTLALNNDYEGGGTYIAKLGKSIKPSLGGLLSFRGDLLLHGGDVIIEGTRYIIAAFCYVSNLNKTAIQGTAGQSKICSSFSEDLDNKIFCFGFQD